jgi:predicted acyltransferase
MKSFTLLPHSANWKIFHERSQKRSPKVKLPLDKRVGSVDVYRGFVMILMLAEVLSIKKVAAFLPGSSFWHFMAYNQTHVEWVGCSLHDIIQPSFTFLVGVVVPYSIESRQLKGATNAAIWKHTIIRALLLILLGIFLRSTHVTETNFTFEDTLTQIGLGYIFLVVLSFYSVRVQVISLAVILVGYWLLFALYPLPTANFDYVTAGVSHQYEYNLHGFAAHWNQNTNAGYFFDRWFLNLFPRQKPFLNNSGGYNTLNFMPTLGTMILGLLAGQILKTSNKKETEKRNIFLKLGTALIIIGLLLQVTGINPIVKKIWTPAWTLFSGGLCFILLAFFYTLIDIAGVRKWSYLFMIVGVNSIAAYMIAHLGIRDFITHSLYIHLGSGFDKVFGVPYASLVAGGLTLLFEWLILYWMYKKRIFLKI